MLSTSGHLRVAFLPFGPITLKSLRSKPYKENPQTLGERLRKPRIELNLFQKAAARRLGVSEHGYLGWELDRKSPTVRSMCRIIKFLGYDPWPAGTTIGDQLRARRRVLGLTQGQAATQLGIDEGTLRRYESGEWKPKGVRLMLIQSLIKLAPK